MCFHVPASRQSPGRWEISVLDKGDSVEPYNTMLSPVVKGLVSTILQCCRDCVWMKGVWKNEERRSGTSPSLRLWPSKSHAVIEYRTNASIYYLNMLHYHYASPSLYRSCSLSLSHTHSETQMQECFPYTIFDDEIFAHCRSEIEKQNGRKMEMERARQKESLALWASLSLCSVLCVKR